MGSAISMRDNVAEIIRTSVNNNEYPIVVVSAMSGVTNKLLKAASMAVGRDGQGSTEQLNEIKQLHIKTVHDAVANQSISDPLIQDINNDFDHMSVFLDAISTVGELSSRSHDIVLSMGEKLSARILTSVLNDKNIKSEYIDLSTIISEKLSYDSNAYWDEVQQFFNERLTAVKKDVVPVLTGFFGSTDNGILDSVGRGYSDFCASLAGAAMNAEEIQIWTDVDGVLSANPKIVPNAFILDRVSFDEMAELAVFGAKVLHPNSIRPALKAGIPLRILNTFNPENRGTVITDELNNSTLPFKSIAYKNNITIIRICSSHMLMAYGFLAKISEIFARHKVSIDLVATSEVSVSLSVDEKPEEIENLLTDLSELGTVETKPGQSVVCIVGSEMKERCTIQARIFSALDRDDITVNMTTMGISRLNFSFVVDDKNCDKAVKNLHKEFFK